MKDALTATFSKSTFYIIVFPNRSSVLADVLIPSSPFHLAMAISSGELVLKQIHSFHYDEDLAIEIATKLLRSSVLKFLNIAEEV